MRSPRIALMVDFYPRSPCGERLLWVLMGDLSYDDFYPRSPCGERQRLGLLGWLRTLISIHALLAESDACILTILICTALFLSTLSLRRATPSKTRRLTNLMISIHALLAESDLSIECSYHNIKLISIHALLAESDPTISTITLALLDFYPRSPCGERRGSAAGSWRLVIFLSTLSLRRATIF